MGCCLTTTTGTTTAATTTTNDSKTSSKRRDAPPSLPFEEETVKEVLSETPITSKPPSTPTKISSHNQQIPLPQPEQKFRSKNDVVECPKISEENASEISSEMYTYSASFSAATTTTIGTIDEEGEVTQKVKKLPPGKTVSRRQPTNYSGERGARKERGIRPLARHGTTSQRHRNVVPSSVIGREPPGRRSKSPALRGEAGQVTKVKERSSVRKSGDRVPVKENKGNVKLKKINGGGGGGAPELKPKPEPETCESLENPRVSLECFIFL